MHYGLDGLFVAHSEPENVSEVIPREIREMLRPASGSALIGLFKVTRLIVIVQTSPYRTFQKCKWVEVVPLNSRRRIDAKGYKFIVKHSLILHTAEVSNLEEYELFPCLSW